MAVKFPDNPEKSAAHSRCSATKRNASRCLHGPRRSSCWLNPRTGATAFLQIALRVHPQRDLVITAVAAHPAAGDQLPVAPLALFQLHRLLRQQRLRALEPAGLIATSPAETATAGRNTRRDPGQNPARPAAPADPRFRRRRAGQNPDAAASSAMLKWLRLAAAARASAKSASSTSAALNWRSASPSPEKPWAAAPTVPA